MILGFRAPDNISAVQIWRFGNNIRIISDLSDYVIDKHLIQNQ
jgi:hypothetical protein